MLRKIRLTLAVIIFTMTTLLFLDFFACFSVFYTVICRLHILCRFHIYLSLL